MKKFWVPVTYYANRRRFKTAQLEFWALSADEARLRASEALADFNAAGMKNRRVKVTAAITGEVVAETAPVRPGER